MEGESAEDERRWETPVGRAVREAPGGPHAASASACVCTWGGGGPAILCQQQPASWNTELEYLEHHRHLVLPQFKSVWYKNHFKYFYVIVSFCFQFLFSFIKSSWLKVCMSVNSLILEKWELILTLTVTSIEAVPFVQGTEIYISIINIFTTSTGEGEAFFQSKSDIDWGLRALATGHKSSKWWKEMEFSSIVFSLGSIMAFYKTI